MISNVKKSANCSSFSWCKFIRIIIKDSKHPSMDGCLYMTPTIVFDFLGLTIPIKVDSSSFFL